MPLVSRGELHALSAAVRRATWLTTLGLGSAFLVAGAAYGDDTSATPAADATQNTAPQLKTVTVEAHKETPVEAAKAQLNEVPGGTSVVDSEEVAKGRTATLQDTLAYQPGVFVQSTGGTDAAKISIRGSGANTSPGYFREGIKFLFDGLPITGPGGTPYEFLGGQGVNYTEILRGANAFQYGALALGGAINFVNQTGYTAPGLRVRAETGSYGYNKQSISDGGVSGPLDYYISLENYRNDGYRDYSLSKSQGVVANFGYQFSSNLKTELMLRYRDEYHNDPSATTLSQVLHHPSQASATAASSGAGSRRPGSVWIGDKTTYTFDDDSTLAVGFNYYKYDHNNSPNSPSNPSYWEWTDLSALINYQRSDELFGHQDRSSISFTSTDHLKGQVNSTNANKVSQKFVDYKSSFDHVFALGNDLELVDGLWLTTGVSAINVRRDVRVKSALLPNTTQYPSANDYNTWEWAPRVGIRYEFTPQLQVFANVSRSIDPPADWEDSGSGPTQPYVRPLVTQKANTVELGIKGSAGPFDGSLTLYRSWLRDEMLNVQLIAATSTAAALTGTFNASSPTIHQGIEAGLNTQLWQGAAGDKINFRQVYTYSDFHYVHDDTFGSNQLPGIPKNAYQGELQYQHPTGWYTGVNVQSDSRTAVDYANTFYAPSYTIYGANVGYEAPGDKWKVSLDLKNLTNKKYVTAVQPAFNVQGKDTAALYPGDGIGAYVGVEYRY